MGLDLVDLSMQIEEEFDIVLLDQTWSSVCTVGDLIDLVWAIRRDSGAVTSRDETADRLRTVIVATLGVDPSDVVEEARLAEDLGC